MGIRKQTNMYYILDSGTVLLNAINECLNIPISVEDQESVNIKLIFASKDGESSGIKKEVIEDQLVITCINFDAEMGTFTIEPINIAFYNEKAILLHIMSSLAGNDTNRIRRVEYTIYMEK